MARKPAKYQGRKRVSKSMDDDGKYSEKSNQWILKGIYYILQLGRFFFFFFLKNVKGLVGMDTNCFVLKRESGMKKVGWNTCKLLFLAVRQGKKRGREERGEVFCVVSVLN